MNSDTRDFQIVRNLVGDVTPNDLKYVDYYVFEQMGIFIPSIGFCEYAIKYQHTHPAYSFILLLSDDQCIVKPEIKIKPNHYLVTALSPDVPHEENQSETFTRYIAIMIEKEFYEKNYSIYKAKEPDCYVWTQFLVEYDIMNDLKKFMTECESRLPGRKQMMEALAHVITNHIVRGLLNINATNDVLCYKFEINAVIEYIHQHFGKRITIQQMAKIANMSQSHFIRSFKKETNLSPMEYLIKVRLDKAKKFLKNCTKNMTEISLLCGFNSPSHFSTSFTKHVGIAPSEYQKAYIEK